MTTAAICATLELSWRLSFYRGEQYDSDLSLYYLRARYYNPATGRFLSRDPEDGDIADPASLHKYLYTGDDPVNMLDPTGRGDAPEFALLEESVLPELREVTWKIMTSPTTAKVVKGAAIACWVSNVFVRVAKDLSHPLELPDWADHLCLATGP
jgi:RHS repeat-associated protein